MFVDLLNVILLANYRYNLWFLILIYYFFILSDAYDLMPLFLLLLRIRQIHLLDQELSLRSCAVLLMSLHVNWQLLASLHVGPVLFIV